VSPPHDGATRALKLSRAEGEIDWNLPAQEVSAKIRAFTSNPGAWTNFRNSTIKISAPFISENILTPGEIALIDKRLYIGTATQALQIGFITSMGKSQTDAQAWANGARLKPGERCE
jgi:methionyl-tRNA formyltransferase